MQLYFLLVFDGIPSLFRARGSEEVGLYHKGEGKWGVVLVEERSIMVTVYRLTYFDRVGLSWNASVVCCLLFIDRYKRRLGA